MTLRGKQLELGRAESQPLAVDRRVVLSAPGRGTGGGGAGSVEECREQRRPVLPQSRARQLPEEVPRPHLLLTQEVGRGIHGKARDSVVLKQRRQLALAVPPCEILDQRVDEPDLRTAVSRWLQFGSIELGGVVWPEVEEAVPVAGAQDEQVHVAIDAREDVGGGGVLVLAAVACDLDAVEGRLPDHVFLGGDALLHRDVQDLARPVLVPLEERQQYSIGGENRAVVIGLRLGWPHRAQYGVARNEHEPAHRDGHHVGGLVRRVGTVLAEGGERRHHQSRIASLELGRTEAELRKVARSEALDQHVDMLDQLEEHAPAVVGLDVEGDALLPTVQEHERQARLGVDHAILEGSEMPYRVAPWRFDLDDAHSEVRQDPSGELTLLVREVKGAQTVEHRHGALRRCARRT